MFLVKNNIYFICNTIIEIKLQFAKYFLDGSIGSLTWGSVKKPQLEDYTAHFKTDETITQLSGLSKLQYAEIGYNPIRDEFELVCMNFYCSFNFVNNSDIICSIFFRKMIMITMQKQF